MTSANQVTRMLALVPYLQEHRGVPVADLAREFGVSPRVVHQDLNLLMMTGSGKYGGELIDVDLYALEDNDVVYISDADFMRRPLRLSRREAAALIVALRALRAAADPEQARIIDTALAKLEGAATDESAAAVDVHIEPVDPAVRRVAGDAVTNGRQVHLTYAGASRDDVTERDVDPIRLHATGGRVYLEGWCHRAADLRFFRLDRVLTIAPTGLPATERPATRDLGETLFVAASDGPEAVFDLRPAAQWMVEEFGAEVLARNGDVLRVRIRSGDTEWLHRLALRHAESATVVEPAQLREAVRAAARSALVAYDQE